LAFARQGDAAGATLTDSGCTICDVGLLAPQCNRWVDMT